MGLRDLAKAHLDAIGKSRAGNCPASGHLGLSGPDKAPQPQQFLGVEPVRTPKAIRTVNRLSDSSDTSDNPDSSDTSDRKNRAAMRDGLTDRWCVVCGSMATLAVFNPAAPRAARWLCEKDFREWVKR